jgi:predicted ester cyclase
VERVDPLSKRAKEVSMSIEDNTRIVQKSILYLEVYQFRDGKVVSGHTHIDSLGLMAQLGVVTPPEQGGS